MNINTRKLITAGSLLALLWLAAPPRAEAWQSPPATQGLLADYFSLSGEETNASGERIRTAESVPPTAEPEPLVKAAPELPRRPARLTQVEEILPDPSGIAASSQSGGAGVPVPWDMCGHGVAGDPCRLCQGYSWPAESVVGQCYLTDAGWVCDGMGCDVQCRPLYGAIHAFRLGAWGVDTDGDLVKVGEFQDLNSSEFWDLDSIWSDGTRTLDFTLSGLDREANTGQARYYGGPGLSVWADYRRYLRRLDHLPLSGFDLNSGVPGPTDNVVGEDLNVGEDYAFRVQQLDSRFQGRLTNNLRWTIDLWAMRKSGERQANAMGHCFDIDPSPGVQNLTCHVLSQRQIIDWTTVEVTPKLEACVGKVNVQYSRTMRGFGQNDQIVSRTYTAFDYTPAFGTGGPPFNYAWVPENFTQVDRIQVSAPLNQASELYAHAYFGNTENKFRDTDRRFNGYDVRLTSRVVPDSTVTLYANMDEQKNELPVTFLTAPPFGISTGNPSRFEPGSLRHPVDYRTARAGLKGRWLSPAKSGLSVVGGYEYAEISRDFAEYDTFSGTYTQQDTQSHQIKIGPVCRISPALDTFVRYNAFFITDPLVGAGSADAFNSNQPEQIHRVEIGGTWTPSPCLMTTALFGVENSWHDSEFADFNEDNYPVILTLWYAPSPGWSITGGYAYFSNWIDQDISIGFRDNPIERTRWNYEGYNQLFSLSGDFAWSPRTTLVGGVEWNWGTNVFSVPPSPAGADWSALATFSDVIVETTRVNVGVDHRMRPDAYLYFRYVHFDYEDLSVDYNSGTADMFLTGFTMLR
jgi:hypothetical protein